MSANAPKFSGVKADTAHSPHLDTGLSGSLNLPDIEVIDDTPPHTTKKNLSDNKLFHSGSTMPESAEEDKVRKTVFFPSDENFEVIE